MGKPWFHPKRYGYGAGLPCSWEGWAVLAIFMAVAVSLAFGPFADRPVALGLMIGADVIVLVLVCAFKTRGGWRWRWGQD